MATVAVVANVSVVEGGGILADVEEGPIAEGVALFVEGGGGWEVVVEVVASADVEEVVVGAKIETNEGNVPGEDGGIATGDVGNNTPGVAGVGPGCGLVASG